MVASTDSPTMSASVPKIHSPAPDSVSSALRQSGPCNTLDAGSIARSASSVASVVGMLASLNGYVVTTVIIVDAGERALPGLLTTKSPRTPSGKDGKVRLNDEG